MASTVSFKAVIQQGRVAARGLVPCVQRTTFDPTAAAGTATGITLPQGAVVDKIVLDGGATGGITPDLDIGTVAVTDGYLNAIAADSVTINTELTTEAGASWDQVVLAADTVIVAGTGGSDATGGTVTMDIWYFTVPGSSKDPSSE